MKNWKTTIAGIVLSAYPIVDAIMQAYNSGYFTDKTGLQLWLGIGFIIIGVLAKDYNVTGGTKNIMADAPPEPPIAGGGQKNP